MEIPIKYPLESDEKAIKSILKVINCKENSFHYKKRKHTLWHPEHSLKIILFI